MFNAILTWREFQISAPLRWRHNRAQKSEPDSILHVKKSFFFSISDCVEFKGEFRRVSKCLSTTQTTNGTSIMRIRWRLAICWIRARKKCIKWTGMDWIWWIISRIARMQRDCTSWMRRTIPFRRREGIWKCKGKK